MKGYFNLNFQDHLLFFGRIPDPIGSAFTIGDLTGQLIAHDVVEHDIGHRNRPYVTFENELRAVGAIEVVRPAIMNVYTEILDLCPSYRTIEPVPLIMRDFLIRQYVDTELVRHLIYEHSWLPENARNAVHQIAWGRHLKEKQQERHFHHLGRAFYFIENSLEEAFEILQDAWGTISGVSCYFDSDMQIFRVRKRYQPVFINY